MIVNDMNSSSQGHILIGGTGRSGTTVLVQIFTFLGFDTGFTLEQAINDIDPISRGGLERSLADANLPQVVKSPLLCHEIETYLQNKFCVKIAIVPIRNLYDAAESRRSISAYASAKGDNPKQCTGGLWEVNNGENQESLLAVNLFKFIKSLVDHEIPLDMLSFPRFLEDPEYLYTKLQNTFREKNITLNMLKNAYLQLVDVNLINNSKKIAQDLTQNICHDSSALPKFICNLKVIKKLIKKHVYKLISFAQHLKNN